MNKQKGNVVGFVIAIVALVAIVLIIGFVKSTPTTGGSFSPVNRDSYSYSVDGTEVISHLRALTASGLTVSGAASLGSTTAGVNIYRPVVTYTADTTLTASQTGSTFDMGTAGLDLTLPAVASSKGVSYRFVVSAAYATTNMTVVSAEGDNIEGSLIVAGAVVDCDANDVITSVNDGENIGDFFDLFSDGTYWFIGASGGLTASKLTCSG